MATSTPNLQLRKPTVADNVDVAADLDANWDILDALFTPGLIYPFGGSAAPSGWFLADGSAVSRSNNPRLFSVYGTTYGAGDGSTTFNLPNLKGKVIVAQDSAQVEFDVLGETGGEKTHLLTAAEIPEHTHHPNLSQGTTAGIANANDGAVRSATNLDTTTFHTGGMVEPHGGAHNNLQPYIVLNYLIKAG